MHRFTAELWQWQGDAPWHFVTLPVDLSDDLRERGGERRGFGSLRVRVTVGTTTWSTSVFPDKGRGAYLLPVKKQVRSGEALVVGEPDRRRARARLNAHGG